MTNIKQSFIFSESNENASQLTPPSAISVCCCCLELAWKRFLWKPYIWLEQEETCGEMLHECFGILFPNKEHRMDHICEVCVTQLRSALNFKRKVLTCQKLLLNNVKELKDIPNLKFETTIPDHVVTPKPKDMYLVGKDLSDPVFIDVHDHDGHIDDRADNEHCVDFVDDHDIDFLDLDEFNETPLNKKVKKQLSKNKEHDFTVTLKPIENGAGREKLHYDDENINRSSEVFDCKKQKNGHRNLIRGGENAVKTNSHFQTKGSHKETKENYRLPTGGAIKTRKNSYFLKRSSKKQPNIGKKKSLRQLNSIKLRLNTGLLLAHSTMVPFKANLGWFFCFYCNKQFALFDEVQRHTAEIHQHMSFDDIISRIYKPVRVRTDVGNLKCKLCHKKIQNVDSLVHHLVEEHNIQFNENARKPADCVIPYDMSNGKQRCSICKKQFIFFKSLSKHMNEHTTNYVCHICGKCFLLPERLGRHRLIHNTEHVECKLCGQKLKHSYLLQGHMRNVHNKNAYGCSLCHIKFKTFKDRLEHLEKRHGCKVTNLKCLHCDKVFTMPSTLYSHIKHYHMNIQKEAKYCCDYCGRKFKSKNDLRRHILVHTGERNFECPVCHKKYGRQTTLTGHLKIHRNDRRWECGACNQTFVQKCSLIGHIRARHKGVQVDHLLMYNKPKK